MGAGASASASTTSNEVLELLTPELTATLARCARDSPATFGAAIQSIRDAAAKLPDATSTAAAAVTAATPTYTTAATPAAVTTTGTLSERVVHEINACRTNPSAFAARLEKTKQYYQGKNVVKANETTLVTNEGVSAVDECIQVLQKTAPMSPLTLPMCAGLTQSCQDHNDDTGPKGITGHDGSEGSKPADRINRHGLWSGGCAENISYGHDDPFQIVAQLLVDDGVPSRGHRKNLLTPAFNNVGVAVGPHKIYRVMCTQNFANQYKDGPPSYDRKKALKIVGATSMTPELISFLTIVPFENIVEKIKSALESEGDETKVDLDFTPPGTLAVKLESAGGSSSFSCTFG